MTYENNMYMLPDGTWSETEPSNYVFKTAKLPVDDATSDSAFDNMYLGSSISSDGNKLFTGTYASQSKILTGTTDGTGFYKTAQKQPYDVLYDSTQLPDTGYTKALIALHDVSEDRYIGIEKVSLKNLILDYSISERTYEAGGSTGTIYELSGTPTLHVCEHDYYTDGTASTYTKNMNIEVLDTTPIYSDTYYTPDNYPYDISFKVHRSKMYPATEARDENICRSYAGGSINYFEQDTSIDHYAKLKNKELYSPYESETHVGLCANTFSCAVDTSLNDGTVIFPIDDDNLIEFEYDGTSYVKRVAAKQQFCSLHGILLHIAKIGLPFKYDGKVYKPVTDDDNVIVDYTDDMSKSSSWDTWDKNTDIVRPTGKKSTDNDGIDDMEFDNNVSFVGGMVDYYIATAGNVATISDGINADTEHIGVSDNIVSLMAYRINPSRFASGAMATTVKCGKLEINTGNITKITALNPVLSLGSIAVSGKHGTRSNPHFLDVSPYTKYDLYIPFCGTIDLPSRIVYNTIEVYLIGDIITGSCLGVVKCNGEIVGTKSGIIGRSVPMTFNASAEQHYAMLNGVMNGIGAGSGVLISGLTNNISGLVSGTMSGLSNITQQIQAANSNYTHTIGVTGSICEGSMPEQCYLRRYSPKDLSDATYTATYGRPCCKNKSLSSGMGFTIVDNAVISGVMSDTEKNEIISLMKTGIIL